MTEPTTVLEARALTKTYRKQRAGGVETIPVLERLDLEVAAGERVAVQGQSGIGKTTLLNLLGGLDRPDGGAVLLRGIPLPAGGEERAKWRRRGIGFIFQFHGLLREFTALENVLLAGLVRGRSRREAAREAAMLLDRVGLAQRADHRPDELSGGEQQRVAVARALLGQPSAVLADEPTGNLDPRTGERVLDLLFEIQERDRFALVVASHSEHLARRCHRILRMEEGRLAPAERPVPAGPAPPSGPDSERMTEP